MNHEKETYINGKDIWVTYKARLIHDSFTNLLLPASRKEFTQNDFRHQPGKQIFVSDPQPSDKEVQLTFLIIGTDRLDFLQKYRSLVAEIESGWIDLKVIPLQMVYRIIMDSAMSLDVAGNDNTGLLVVKFNEPNPKNQDQIVEVLGTIGSKILLTLDQKSIKI